MIALTNDEVNGSHAGSLHDAVQGPHGPLHKLRPDSRSWVMRTSNKTTITMTDCIVISLQIASQPRPITW
jgi:hypothetical protein